MAEVQSSKDGHVMSSNANRDSATASAKVIDSKTRNEMVTYWQKRYTGDDKDLGNVIGWKNPGPLDKAERPEILSQLPKLDGLRIIDIGAGIGRYTKPFAEKAEHVIAVDFVDDFTRINRETHAADYPNVEFLTSDAMSLEYDDNSFDLVFSNWLQVYLTEAEVELLATRMLRWVKPGGHVYFRESSYPPKYSKEYPPTPAKLYRAPHIYNDKFEVVNYEDGDQCYAYELEFSRSLQSFIKERDNPYNISWRWRKVAVDKQTRSAHAVHGSQSLRHWLDGQYSKDYILFHEKLCGKHYLSAGGPALSAEFVPQLKLQASELVLDVGCGFGGDSLYMASNFDVDVLGMDLSTNLFHNALETVTKCTRGSVAYEMSDVSRREIADGSFDAIFSRDTLYHVPNKADVFKSFYRWLRPGGRILLLDYCHSSTDDSSNEFRQHVDKHHVSLQSVQQYGQLLRDASFTDVTATDYTVKYTAALQLQIEQATGQQDALKKEFSEDVYSEMVADMKALAGFFSRGDICWGVFSARKA